MKMSQISSGNIAVITLDEPLIGAYAEQLTSNVQEYLSTGAYQLILNFNDVSLIDSRGLEQLLECVQVARKIGGTVKLAGANGICADILYATRISQRIEVYKDVSMAYRSFF